MCGREIGVQQREARDGMGIPRSDLETGDGRRGKAGEASASIIVDLGETRTRRRREGMNRRENWRGMIEGEGEEGKEKQRGRERRRVERRVKEKRKTHEWFCCWMKLNSSLILSQVSATVNFSPPAAPPLPPPPCNKKRREGGKKRGKIREENSISIHDKAAATKNEK